MKSLTLTTRLATSFSVGLSLESATVAPEMGERRSQHALEKFSAIASCLAMRRRIGLSWRRPAIYVAPSKACAVCNWHSKIFLAVLAEGLTGKTSPIRVSLFRRLQHNLIAALEDLTLPAAFFALAVMGLAFMGGLGWVVGWVLSQPLEWLGLHGWAQGVRIYFVASIIFTMTVVGVMLGRSRATELYARFWAPDQS